MRRSRGLPNCVINDSDLKRRNAGLLDAPRRWKRCDRKVSGAEDVAESMAFESISAELRRRGHGFCFQARGGSMSPSIRDGEIVYVRPVTPHQLRNGDIVLIKALEGFRLHRLVVTEPDRDVFITRGDCGEQNDSAVSGAKVIGIADSKEIKLAGFVLTAKFRGVCGKILRATARTAYLVEKIFKMARWRDRTHGGGSSHYFGKAL